MLRETKDEILLLTTQVRNSNKNRIFFLFLAAAGREENPSGHSSVLRAEAPGSADKGAEAGVAGEAGEEIETVDISTVMALL